MAEQLIPKNQSLNIQRYEYRLVYAKTGRARYISHLDLMRAMQRVFKRAGVPLWYTQGFNPHAYLMFPLALPLGTDSSIEVLDIALTQCLDFDEIRIRLNEKMPEGLKIMSVSTPVMKHTEIATAEYRILLKTNHSADETCKLFSDFLSRDKIEVEKRSKKKGVNLVDIKPHIKLAELSVQEDSAVLELVLPAGNDFNLNTGVVMDAFAAAENVEMISIYTERTKIMTKSGENFI